MALVDSRTGDLELSLKLYHPRELQLGYQQSITEAPAESYHRAGAVPASNVY